MELIKPFVQYSRSYRIAGDEQEKSTIFKQWCLAIGKLPVSSDDSTCTEDFCDFCYSRQTYTSFCLECLFPLPSRCHDRIINQELFTYSVISVCFYELLLNSTTTSNIDRLVWQERIKFTWRMHESMTTKLYKVDCVQCFQCRTSSSENLCDIYYNSFSLKLFCVNCLFPLFTIISSFKI